MPVGNLRLLHLQWTVRDTEYNMAEYGFSNPGIPENRHLPCDDWSDWKGVVLRIR